MTDIYSLAESIKDMLEGRSVKERIAIATATLAVACHVTPLEERGVFIEEFTDRWADAVEDTLDGDRGLTLFTAADMLEAGFAARLLH